ncbi:peptide chain release factor N(5)-glutamine methyltransferase [Thermoflavimicrobium dichotomicum]|uniref:Release factor glutamine methyltransferase n=1 Tax=Thermoflavimicrobium dichotomicum TaxID=46223 RepID=A0A1I3K3H7_9BACL|nr:peptide chain release factor N(5)-glutamine methyltransferase [Thermoflavimicrobium dichotomicum]SFI67033.1 release factor glutamine methyltransferase [Thermoflavimicrobium dichotomicum]
MNTGKSIRVAYQMAASFLHKHGIESPEFEAEWLLRRILGVDRTQFFMIWDQLITPEQEIKLQQWLNRRAHGEPLQYIFGDQEFYGRLFTVTPAVLIPRPETELLVEAVIQEAIQKWELETLHVVDVGTGSGCIAITLAKECPHWRFTAIDISQEALQVARINAKKHAAVRHIRFVHGEYLSPMLQEGVTFDILVSNPPYIPSSHIQFLEKQVSEYEPKLALDGGEDGLEPYRVLTRQVAMLPVKPRLIAFEIGHDQGEAVAQLVENLGAQVQIRKDWAGHDRIVLGKM